jgi:hypothetical protein
MADGGLLDKAVEIERGFGGGDGAAAIGVEDLAPWMKVAFSGSSSVWLGSMWSTQEAKSN